MTTIDAPPHPMVEPSPEPTEQELVYEWFRGQPWTEEAYLALAEVSNHFLEFSDGRLVILPMPSLTHQRILKRFQDCVTLWLNEHPLGEVLFAPHPIRLWPGKYREPDAMIWLNEHHGRMGEKESDPPDLALEVHSPTNTPLDREDKFREYALAGVTEYWMVSPQTRRVSVFTLEGRTYKLLAHFGPGERARSVILPGFEIAVDDLFSVEASSPDQASSPSSTP